MWAESIIDLSFIIRVSPSSQNMVPSWPSDCKALELLGGENVWASNTGPSMELRKECQPGAGALASSFTFATNQLCAFQQILLQLPAYAPLVSSLSRD